MQVFIEAADLDKLNQAREDAKAEMDAHLAETNKTLDTMRDEVHSPFPSSTWVIKPHQLVSASHSTLHKASGELSLTIRNRMRLSMLGSTVLCPDQYLSRQVPCRIADPVCAGAVGCLKGCIAVQLRKEGVEPEEGSPEARAEMLNILEELGFDGEASVRGSDEPSWWQKEQAAREEAASSSAAATAEAAAQQRQDQRQMQAEAEAEGVKGLLKSWD